MSLSKVVLAVLAAGIGCAPTVEAQDTKSAVIDPGSASLCAAGDAVVFSCRAGSKTVSVCASRDASANSGTLLYRFGTPGEMELTLPEAPALPPRSAIGQAVPFSGGGAAYLSFRKGAVTYSVYDGIGNWGPRGQKKTISGVVVEQAGKRLANLKCTAPPTSELGPDFFDKLGIKGGEQDFNFPIED